MQEEWRDVIGYEKFYSVSNLGRIRRDKSSSHANSGKIIKHIRDSRGYACANFHKNGTRKVKRIHMLVSQVFLGPCPIGHNCNHIDGNKMNPAFENLEYVTFSENLSHSYRLGLSKPHGKRGEENLNSKLNNEKVMMIRKIYKDKKLSQQKIAEMFNVSQVVVSHVILKKSWKHI